MKEDIANLIKSNPKMKDLVAFHTSYKYLIYAKSPVAYKILGNIVANRDKQPLEEIIKSYNREFVVAISQKDDIAKIYNVLFHIYGYFKDRVSKDEREQIITSIEKFRDGMTPLVDIIELLNLYINRFDIEYLQNQKFLNKGV